MTYEQLHWRVFNIMFRLLGLAALIAGAVAVAWAVIVVAYPAAVAWYPEPRPSPTAVRVTGFLVGALLIVSGRALIRARTFRPDLGDALWFVDPIQAKHRRQSDPELRSWWTGTFSKQAKRLGTR